MSDPVPTTCPRCTVGCGHVTHGVDQSVRAMATAGVVMGVLRSDRRSAGADNPDRLPANVAALPHK